MKKLTLCLCALAIVIVVACNPQPTGSENNTVPAETTAPGEWVVTTSASVPSHLT